MPYQHSPALRIKKMVRFSFVVILLFSCSLIWAQWNKTTLPAKTLSEVSTSKKSDKEVTCPGANASYWSSLGGGKWHYGHSGDIYYDDYYVVPGTANNRPPDIEFPCGGRDADVHFYDCYEFYDYWGTYIATHYNVWVGYCQTEKYPEGIKTVPAKK